jgi:hypothetical protein
MPGDQSSGRVGSDYRDGRASIGLSTCYGRLHVQNRAHNKLIRLHGPARDAVTVMLVSNTMSSLFLHG